jgi:hypothetical protein
MGENFTSYTSAQASRTGAVSFSKILDTIFGQSGDRFRYRGAGDDFAADL